MIEPVTEEKVKPERVTINDKLNEIKTGDALIKEACKVFSVANEYLRTSNYKRCGIITEKKYVTKNGKKVANHIEHQGELATITTVGGERARLLKKNDGKYVVEVRDVVVCHDSIKAIKPLRETRITGIILERIKSDSGY